MSETKETERLLAFEERRMWRLLLARLHPDAGGDHDLFAFACAMRDEMSSASSLAKDTEREDSVRGTEGLVAPFLHFAWLLAQLHVLLSPIGRMLHKEAPHIPHEI